VPRIWIIRQNRSWRNKYENGDAIDTLGDVDGEMFDGVFDKPVSHHVLPMFIAGSGGGQFDTGRHLNCSAGTPLANLWLSLADSMGVQLDRFADSTEKLKGFI
jgi:hypothetical protein